MGLGNILRTSVFATLLASACVQEPPHTRAVRIAQERQEQRAAEQRRNVEIASLYENSAGIASYTITHAVINIQKQSLSLDPMDHIENAMKAVTFTVPVSSAYMLTHPVGTVLDAQFNFGGFIFEGTISAYEARITDTQTRSLFCTIQNDTCRQTDEDTFNRLRAMNDTLNAFVRQEENLYLREDANMNTEPFTRSCAAVIETRKDNLTFDPWRHVANSMQRLELAVEIPSFACDQLRPGEPIDHSFVGASLFFSSSPSLVTYTVHSINGRER